VDPTGRLLRKWALWRMAQCESGKNRGNMATESTPKEHEDYRDDERRNHEFAAKPGKPPFVARARFRRRIMLALAVWGLAMLVVKAVLYLRSQR